MVLVDTSVWVSHLRKGNSRLKTLLTKGEVVCHPFVVGELACGNLQNREEILTLLKSLPMAKTAEHQEILFFIEENDLMGLGLGYIDVNLLSSAILTEATLWTNDKKLGEVSAKLKVSYR